MCEKYCVINDCPVCPAQGRRAPLSAGEQAIGIYVKTAHRRNVANCERSLLSVVLIVVNDIDYFVLLLLGYAYAFKSLSCSAVGTDQRRIIEP